MSDRDGNLDAKYTNDGLHLCWEGYRLVEGYSHVLI